MGLGWSLKEISDSKIQSLHTISSDSLSKDRHSKLQITLSNIVYLVFVSSTDMSTPYLEYIVSSTGL
jgi:hypothetical protein